MVKQHSSLKTKWDRVSGQFDIYIRYCVARPMDQKSRSKINAKEIGSLHLRWTTGREVAQHQGLSTKKIAKFNKT